METFPKFILEDGNLILSKVSYHKDLVTDKSLVRGGGWFRFDLDKRECLLSGASHEFGPCRMDEVKKAVAEGKVYTNDMLTHSIAGDFTFLFDRGSEIVKLN